MVRCFEDENVIHVAGKVDPSPTLKSSHRNSPSLTWVRSKRRCSATPKPQVGNDKEAAKLVAVLEKAQKVLMKRSRCVPEPDRRRVGNHQAAVPDYRQADHVRCQRARRRFENNPHLDAVRNYAAQTNSRWLRMRRHRS